MGRKDPPSSALVGTEGVGCIRWYNWSGMDRWKLEKDLQRDFGRYVRSKNWRGVFKKKGSCAFELKIVKGGSRFRWKQIEPHQVEALKKAGNVFFARGFKKEGRLNVDSGVYHKISDQSLGIKPFDCFYLSGCVYSGVVVGFGESGRCYFVDIWELEEMFREKDRLGEKLTASEDEIAQIGVYLPL